MLGFAWEEWAAAGIFTGTPGMEWWERALQQVPCCCCEGIL